MLYRIGILGILTPNACERLRGPFHISCVVLCSFMITHCTSVVLCREYAL